MGCVYSLTFASGKKYIGITKHDVKRRFLQHKNSAQKGAKQLVYNAWRLHGDPVCAVLKIVKDDQLQAEEILAIKRHKTLTPNGYNCTAGGERSPMEFKETREKYL